MKNIFSYLKTLGYFLLITLTLSLLSAFINLITPISINVLNVIATILMIIVFFIIGIKKGKTSTSKGWLCGIKHGAMLTILLLLISLIFFVTNINVNTFIYYLILILSNIMGSIIGINRKKDN
jgi:putative membrane protein, TIGR04086 family